MAVLGIELSGKETQTSFYLNPLWYCLGVSNVLALSYACASIVLAAIQSGDYSIDAFASVMFLLIVVGVTIFVLGIRVELASEFLVLRSYARVIKKIEVVQVVSVVNYGFLVGITYKKNEIGGQGTFLFPHLFRMSRFKERLDGG